MPATSTLYLHGVGHRLFLPPAFIWLYQRPELRLYSRAAGPPRLNALPSTRLISPKHKKTGHLTAHSPRDFNHSALCQVIRLFARYPALLPFRRTSEPSGILAAGGQTAIGDAALQWFLNSPSPGSGQLPVVTAGSDVNTRFRRFYALAACSHLCSEENSMMAVPGSSSATELPDHIVSGRIHSTSAPEES